MGLYSTVYAVRVCAKCRGNFSTGVQFKTGHENGTLPEFADGDIAADLATGEYDGVADAYCRDCMPSWVVAEKRANLGVLADEARSGNVTVRRGVVVRDAEGVPLSDDNNDFVVRYLDDGLLVGPEAIDAAAEASERRYGWPNFPARLSELSYVLHENGVRIFPTRVLLSIDWLCKHRLAVDLRLKAEGWIYGHERWVDVPVVVTSRQAVVVQEVERPAGEQL